MRNYCIHASFKCSIVLDQCAIILSLGYPDTLSERLAEGGFEPLPVGSMRNNLITELS